MSNLPAQGYMSDGARTEGEMKTAFEDMRGAVAEGPGGKSETTIGISSGVIIPTGASHAIDTEGGAATDDLDRIDYGVTIPDGRWLKIHIVNDARKVVVRHSQGGTGQILLRDSQNLNLASSFQALLLERQGANWVEVTRSSPYGVLGTTVASASAINLDLVAGDFCDISGTATINNIVLSTGRQMTTRFLGGFLVINHSSGLVLPGSRTLGVFPGDVATWRGYGPSGTRLVAFQRISGANIDRSMCLLDVKEGTANDFQFLSFITSEFDEYLVTMNALKFSVENMQPVVRLRVLSFLAGASDYALTGIYTGTPGAAPQNVFGTSSAIGLCGAANVSTVGGRSLNGEIRLFHMSQTLQQTILYDTMWFDTNGAFYNFRAAGTVVSTNGAADGIQIVPTAGTIVSGRACLYGIRRT